MANKKQTNKKTSKKTENLRKKRNKKVLFLIALCVGTLFIVSTYAWFSASLNVKIKFINMKVSTDSGLFISLDGVNFGSEIEVNNDTIINDLKTLYPNHTNQWPINGLWTVSTNGISNPNANKFSMFYGEFGKYRDQYRKGQRYLKTRRISELAPNAISRFVAFDIFLKNVSGSPYDDNLYLTEETLFEFQESVDAERREEMTGIMNSVRLGIVRIGETSLQASVNEIQNLDCNDNCLDVIYEPFSTNHSEKSIEDAKDYGITLTNGEYIPTYGVYAEGNYLDHKSGYYNTENKLDNEHFALQETIVESDFDDPIFTIPNGIIKCRVYIWLEGQDIDSLETHSKGAPINLNIEIIKDLAGYDVYNWNEGYNWNVLND